jgi:hypothetical protein
MINFLTGTGNFGHRYYPRETVTVTWDEVTAFLGREHNGGAEDNEALVAALLAAGAPAWVAESRDGMDEEEGWTIFGPAVPEDLDE